MLNFTFHNPATIHFGKTKLPMLEGELKKRANKILIVTGRGSIKKQGIYDQILKHVKNTGIAYCELQDIKPNPRLSSVQAGIELCKKEKIDFILAVGGGSVIDASKAIAAGVPYNGDVWDFFKTHSGPSEALPIGVVLTIAATGSEMNGNTVITNAQTKEKRATSSPVLIPAFSILNPEFTFSVDAYNTAAGIADIMAHVFENYLTPIPHADVQDRMAEALLKICIHYGPIVCSQPKNYDARANIMWASSLALNGVAGKGKISDWVCHAIEHELSGLYDISHGVGLAILLPHFMKEFLTSETIVNFVNYGTRVWDIDANNDSQSIAEEAIKKTRDFFSSIGLPATLHELGISNEHFEAIMSAAIQCRGKVGHYKQLTRKNIMNILNAAL